MEQMDQTIYLPLRSVSLQTLQAIDLAKTEAPDVDEFASTWIYLFRNRNVAVRWLSRTIFAQKLVLH